MLSIRDPIIQAIRKQFGEKTVSDDVQIRSVHEYFTENVEFGYIIEHFRLSIDSKKIICDPRNQFFMFSGQGHILQNLNELFYKLHMPYYKCVGVYFDDISVENLYLNILIKTRGSYGKVVC